MKILCDNRSDSTRTCFKMMITFQNTDDDNEFFLKYEFSFYSLTVKFMKYCNMEQFGSFLHEAKGEGKSFFLSIEYLTRKAHKIVEKIIKKC